MKPLSLLVSFPTNLRSVRQISRELNLSRKEAVQAEELYLIGLPPLVNNSVLPFLFGISPGLVAWVAKNTTKLYRTFYIPKKNGEKRRIEAPRRFLKLFQTWIDRRILANGHIHDSAFGFVHGRNIFDNANIHINGRNLLVVDLKNFFPSVKYDQVRTAFDAFGFGEDVSEMLTRLCCLKGRLSQGAPTSPALSNLVLRNLDTDLKSWADGYDYQYSRYADDLAFSGQRQFRKRDVSAISELVEGHRFKINKGKTRIVGPGGRQTIAGVVTNSRAQPERLKRRYWKTLFHAADKYPDSFIGRSMELSGIGSYVKTFDRDLSKRYREVARKVARNEIFSI